MTAKAVDGHFNVSVTDTGPGIPDHERTRIFEQFRNVNGSNERLGVDIVPVGFGQYYLSSTSPFHKFGLRNVAVWQ